MTHVSHPAQHAMASATATSANLPLRWTLAVTSVAAATIILSYVGYPLLHVHPKLSTYKDRNYNELTKTAIDLRIDQSKSLSQLNLLMLGALWALVIAKRDEARIVLSDRPELIMFVAASALLLASEVFHIFYLEYIRYFFQEAGAVYAHDAPTIPDLFASVLANQFGAQMALSITGVAMAVLTLVSAHRLK
jgi:hypothetical protein